MGSGPTASDEPAPDYALSVGDVVKDREGKPAEQAIVVNTPPNATADEWYVSGNGLLAEENPGYPERDPVAIVVAREALREEFLRYTGAQAIAIGDLYDAGLDVHPRPFSRLEKVDTLSPTEIHLDRIEPSPYHTRRFDPVDCREFIEEIREEGEPRRTPFVRALPSGRFEIVNGHKRIWACRQAGLDVVPAHVAHLDDEHAARLWVDAHLTGYSVGARETALEEMEERLGRETTARIVADTMGGGDA